ncbi:hypothetical protein [Sporisorium scitamineum]|uniref:Uncharacterized protein n=1 Tax=Sporisorium scitamineum TaxID=49012 RepID=A0A0F7SA11_9BASI|nr:hypothetical protein [Sporisorium scitamineum]
MESRWWNEDGKRTVASLFDWLDSFSFANAVEQRAKLEAIIRVSLSADQAMSFLDIPLD